MLGPFESQTNVQCIVSVALTSSQENVTPLEWHVYGLSAQAYQKAEDPQTATFEPLSTARNDFVQNTFLAHADCVAKVLWIFKLPSHCRSQAHTELDIELSDIAPQHPIRQLDSGTLHASELDSVSRRPLQSPAGGVKSHLTSLGSPVIDSFQSWGMSPTHDGSKATNFGRHEIHDAFIHAILESLSHHLVSRRSMIPLCFNTFVTDPDECYDGMLDDTPDPYDFDATVYSFDDQRRWKSTTIGAEWLPDGSVIIAKWQGCNTYAPFLEWSGMPACEIVLAPIGRKVPSGRLKPLPDLNTQSRSRSGRGRHYRETEVILEILAHKGVQLRTPEKWLICEPGGDLAERGPDNSDTSFIWPTELAFALVSQWSGDQETIWTDPKLAEDPFAVIHHLDSQQMSETMEEDDTDTPRHEMQPVSSDLFADILTEMLGTNSAIGVYPTPPEFSRTQGSTQREQPHFSAPTPATTSSGPGYGMDDSESQLDDLQGDEYQIIENNTDADDLFGDMSVELGTEMLNEDMFGFFDASKKRGDEQVHLQPSEERPSISLMNEDSLETHSRFKEKTVKFESHTSDGEQLSIGGDDLTDTGQGQGSTDMATDSKVEKKSLDAFMTFDSTPLSVRPGKLIDDKYKEGGLFGVSAPPTGPTTHDPRMRLPSRPAIPIITVSNDTKPSWESSSSASVTEDSDAFSSSSSRQEDESDDEMGGVVSSQTSASIVAGKENDKIDLSIIEIASRCMPLLNVTSAPRNDQFQRLSNILDLDKRQFMALAQLVANQVSHWPTQSFGPTGPRRFRNQSKHSLNENESNSSSNNLMEYIGCSLEHQGDTIALGENFAQVANIPIIACAELEPGNLASVNWPAATPKQEAWERSCTTFPRVNDSSSQLQVPNLVFRRDESQIAMSATALPLWAELGLGPSGGPMQVTAYCFVPDAEFWIRGASRFLETMTEVFPLLKLGEHRLGRPFTPDSALPDGVVLVDPVCSFQKYVQSLCRSLSLLGRCLSEDKIAGSIAVYVVNPCDDISVIPFFCAAFQKLQRLISSKNKRMARNLTLKILSRSLFVQDFAFNLPSLCTMKSLAREMYDRCNRPGQTTGKEGTLTHLARPLPDSVNFQFHSTLNRRPLDKPLITHVAYSWKPGNVWISFAFCDDSGAKRWHASYHLPWDKNQCQSLKRRQGQGENQAQSSKQGQAQAGTPTSYGPGVPSSSSSSSTPHTNIWQRFVGVARDVLASLAEISEELMQGQPHVHHVCLVKDGPVTREEKYVWRSLMEKTAKPNGVASILGSGSAGSSQGTSTGNNSNGANSAVIMNWTIAVLDCECPVELQASLAGLGLPGNAYGGGGADTTEQTRPSWQQQQQQNQHQHHFQQDLPTSTPGTPSLASPGMYAGNIGLAGSFPRDAQFDEDEQRRGNARLVTPELLAWFVPARGVLAQSYIGKLELLPTPAMPTNLGSSSATGLKTFAASGGGYLIMNSCSGNGGSCGAGEDEYNGINLGSGDGSAMDVDPARRQHNQSRIGKASEGGGKGQGETGSQSRHRRARARDRRGARCPRVLGLRIVAAKAPSLMDVRQLAEAYRALASIADVYGLGGTLPWHVAMARAARIGLGRCM